MAAKCPRYHMTTQERNVVNLAKGWARALSEWEAVKVPPLPAGGKRAPGSLAKMSAALGKFSRAELRLRRAVAALREAEAREKKARKR